MCVWQLTWRCLRDAGLLIRENDELGGDAGGMPSCCSWRRAR